MSLSESELWLARPLFQVGSEATDLRLFVAQVSSRSSDSGRAAGRCFGAHVHGQCSEKEKRRPAGRRKEVGGAFIAYNERRWLDKTYTECRGGRMIFVNFGSALRRDRCKAENLAER